MTDQVHLPESLIPWIVGGILVGVLIATFLLRLATRLVAGFHSPWTQALFGLIGAQLVPIKERPDSFGDAAWPIRLADETASNLRQR